MLCGDLRGSNATPQAAQLRALVLAGALAGSGRERRGEPLLGGEGGAARHARRAFRIAARRRGRGATPRRDGRHRARKLDRAAHQGDLVAGADLVGGLHARAVDVDPRRLRRLGGERARERNSRTANSQRSRRAAPRAAAGGGAVIGLKYTCVP